MVINPVRLRNVIRTAIGEKSSAMESDREAFLMISVHKW